MFVLCDSCKNGARCTLLHHQPSQIYLVENASTPHLAPQLQTWYATLFQTPRCIHFSTLVEHFYHKCPSNSLPQSSIIWDGAMLAYETRTWWQLCNILWRWAVDTPHFLPPPIFFVSIPASPEPPVCFHWGEIKRNHNYSGLLLFTGGGKASHKTGSAARRERRRWLSYAKGDARCVTSSRSFEEGAAQIALLREYFSTVRCRRWCTAGFVGGWSGLPASVTVIERVSLLQSLCFISFLLDCHGLDDFLTAEWGHRRDVVLQSFPPEWQIMDSFRPLQKRKILLKAC